METRFSNHKNSITQLSTCYEGILTYKNTGAIGWTSAEFAIEAIIDKYEDFIKNPTGPKAWGSSVVETWIVGSNPTTHH